jgi:predicted transglutaminase-like cysteine proteinase
MNQFSRLSCATAFCLFSSIIVNNAQSEILSDGALSGVALHQTLHAGPEQKRGKLHVPDMPFPNQRSVDTGSSAKRVKPNGLQTARLLIAPPAAMNATIGQPPQRSERNPSKRVKQLSFFGTAAVPFANIKSSKDWERVRQSSLEGNLAEKCKTADCHERATILRSFPQMVDNGSFIAKLQKANQLVNETIRYQEDVVTYNRLDYWAAADEITRRGAGDCEDFAILKYDLLLQAGVPASSMSLVVLKDLDRNLFHAVLAVSTNKGHFILDNVVDRVYRDQEVSHYQPLFSFSKGRSWLHGTSVKTAPQQVSSILNVTPGTDRLADDPMHSFLNAQQNWPDLVPVAR